MLIHKLRMEHVIIVAGGKGLRMGADLPKQFLPVGGWPVLMHTLRTFYQYNPLIHIVLVLPTHHQAYWHNLCQQYHFEVPHTIADGGETRFHSSLSGIRALDAAPDTDLVAIHDGVRPFVSADTIARCFQMAEQQGAAIPVLPVTDTLRLCSPDGTSHTVPRDSYRSVQTPQTFRLGLLRQAFAQPFSPAFTDDASVVEAFGHNVTLVEGNRENIKLTTPFDLVVGEALLRDRKKQ